MVSPAVNGELQTPNAKSSEWAHLGRFNQDRIPKIKKIYRTEATVVTVDVFEPVIKNGSGCWIIRTPEVRVNVKSRE